MYEIVRRVSALFYSYETKLRDRSKSNLYETWRRKIKNLNKSLFLKIYYARFILRFIYLFWYILRMQKAKGKKVTFAFVRSQ